MSKVIDYFPAEIYIRQSNEIEGIYNERADADSLEAWDYLITGKSWQNGHLIFDLSLDLLKKVQAKITEHQLDLQEKYKGNLRDCNVMVGGQLCPSPEKAEELLNELLLNYRDFDPIEAHIKYEKIHPWADGNGRSGRMFYWYHCLTMGVTPILFTSENRVDYYRLFWEN